VLSSRRGFPSGSSDPSGGPAPRALSWAIAAHAFVAAALAVSRGHEQPVADLLVFASVPALGAGLLATRAAARTRAPSWPLPRVLVWVWGVALLSTLAVAFVTPGIYIEASAPRLPFLAMSLAGSRAGGPPR